MIQKLRGCSNQFPLKLPLPLFASTTQRITFDLLQAGYATNVMELHEDGKSLAAYDENMFLKKKQ